MRTSVRRRVTWIVTLAAILPVLIVWSLTLWISYRSQQQTKQAEQVALSSLIADNFGRYILNTESQLQLVADTLGRADQPAGSSDEQLATLVRSSVVFQEVALYDSAGRRQAVASRTDLVTMPATISDTPLFAQVKQGQTFYGDPPPVAAGATLPLNPNEVPRLRMAVSSRISFDTRMYLVGDISMSQLWDLTSRIETTTATQLLVLTSNGSLVSAGKPQLLLSPPPVRDLPIFQGATVQTYPNTLDTSVLGVRTPIIPLGWILIVERPLDEIYQAIDRLALSLFVVIVLAVPVVIGGGWLAGRRIAQPIQQLHASVERFSRDPLNYQPVAIGTGDELTLLGAAFNTMASGLTESQAKLTNANESLEELVATRTAELQHTVQELQVQYGEQDRLLETVRRLGMPVIPITSGMVMMPLVGEFGAKRANEISDHLLSAVEREHARIVLADVTGVLTVDEAMVRALLNAISAARLLGTEVIVAGIRPDMAETMISLNIGTGSIRTAATLEQAFKLGIDELNARQPIQQAIVR